MNSFMKILSFFTCLFIVLLFQDVNGQSKLSNRDLVLKYFEEVVNQKKLERLDQVFAETFIRHDLNNGIQQIMTLDQQKVGLSSLFHAFPDLNYTIADILVDNDKVVVQAILKGTHEGEFLGYPPTGNAIDYLSEIFFFRIENGKVVERWSHIDWYNVFKHIDGKK
jgi:steroid delta-isomerase-like uncharacterized protein